MTARDADHAVIVRVIYSNKPAKSLISHYADHRIWQDVYHPSTVAGDVYVKLTVIDDVLIVSFKEL